jgi:hypothetical protein
VANQFTTDLLDTIRSAWRWTGLNATEVLKTNSFGNVLVRNVDGSVWRICPEELKCEKIAEDIDQFASISKSEAFQLDWEMKRMVALAEGKIGVLGEGRSYCFKLSPVLGGRYEGENLADISLLELIAFSGDLAEQIKDVPDGGEIEIE